MRPLPAGVTGGLSGDPSHRGALCLPGCTRAAMPDVPILGMGGIKTGLDVPVPARARAP